MSSIEKQSFKAGEPRNEGSSSIDPTPFQGGMEIGAQRAAQDMDKPLLPGVASDATLLKQLHRETAGYGEKILALKNDLADNKPAAERQVVDIFRNLPDEQRHEVAQWLQRNGMPHAKYHPAVHAGRDGSFQFDLRPSRDPFHEQRDIPVRLGIPPYLNADLQKACEAAVKLIDHDGLSAADQRRLMNIFQPLSEQDRLSLARNVESCLPAGTTLQYVETGKLGAALGGELSVHSPSGFIDNVKIPLSDGKKEQADQTAAAEKERKAKMADLTRAWPEASRLALKDANLIMMNGDYTGLEAHLREARNRSGISGPGAYANMINEVLLKQGNNQIYITEHTEAPQLQPGYYGKYVIKNGENETENPF